MPARLPSPWAWTITATVAAIAFAGVAGWALARGPDSSTSNPQLVSPETLRQPVHWHADFRVVIRGHPFSFDDPRYVSNEERELSPNAHIHAPRFNVVHVHREQTTWGEFLTSLGVGLTQVCLQLPGEPELCSNDDERLRFFVNGVEVDDIRFLAIADLQRLLVYYGPEDPDAILARFDDWVTDEACIVSALCQARIPPEGLENEPCAIGGMACN